MISDEERRDVARRLREAQSYVIPGTETEENPIAGRIIGVACWYDLPDFQGLLGRLADLVEPSIPADPGEAGLACVDAFIREHTEKPVDRDTPQKVAEEVFGKMRHSTKEEADAYDAMLKSKSVEIHPVDRDALLRLADELEEDACWEVQSPGVDNRAWMLKDVCDRIREALGVQDA